MLRSMPKVTETISDKRKVKYVSMYMYIYTKWHMNKKGMGSIKEKRNTQNLNLARSIVFQEIKF